MADNNESASAGTSGINFLDFLPTEIITLILTQRELYFRDVLNFGISCKRYHAIINDNELWKVKLKKRWPCLRQTADNVAPTPDWLNHCKRLDELPNKVRAVVGCLSAKNFHRNEVTYAHFRPLKGLYLDDDLCQALIDDILMGIVNDKELHKDLTHKYYAQKVLRYVRHIQLRKEWEVFFALPIEQQILLEGAILFERWYNPFSPSPQDNIRQDVTEIATRVRRKLKTGHPCCLGSIEGVVEMTPDQCYEVLDAVNEVMFKEMEFRGNSDDYYNESNSFMSQVLRRKLGIPITLCILYEAVVRKLGIVLRPVNFPGHFVLRWNYSPDGFKELDTNLFIDAFKKGQVMTSAEVFMGGGNIGVHGYNHEYLQPCPPRDVFRRMTANVTNLRQMNSHGSNGNGDGIEMQAVLNPDDFEAVFGCAKYYVERHINYSESLQMLPKVRPRNEMETDGIAIFIEMVLEAIEQDKQEDAVLSPKIRAENKEVMYTVGMVMKHKRYHYSCVIYGWDLVCKLSRQWQRQMGVDRLPRQENQPFYNVLVEDSSSRYAAQENLEYTDVPIAISHPEVGRYFHEFTKICYLPNEQLAKLYPDDTAITTQKATELYAD